MVMLADGQGTPPAMVKSLGQAQAFSGAATMWKHETRRRYVKYENTGLEQWVNSPTLVRDDGVSLMLVGRGLAMPLTFVYSDGERTFEFYAGRYIGNEISNAWFVLLGIGLNRLEGETGQSVSFATAREIADNIGEGLLAWPWYGRAENSPAQEVRFDVKSWRHWSPALGWGE